MDVRHRLGERIKGLRLARGLTQEQLAAASTLHVTYLSSLERGHRNPSLHSCKLISDALGMSLAELFKGV